MLHSTELMLPRTIKAHPTRSQNRVEGQYRIWQLKDKTWESLGFPPTSHLIHYAILLNHIPDCVLPYRTDGVPGSHSQAQLCFHSP